MSTDEIERELDDTRFRLDATIEALQQKLAPSSMVDEAITYFKEGGGVEFTAIWRAACATTRSRWP